MNNSIVQSHLKLHSQLTEYLGAIYRDYLLCYSIHCLIHYCMIIRSVRSFILENYDEKTQKH